MDYGYLSPKLFLWTTLFDLFIVAMPIKYHFDHLILNSKNLLNKKFT